MGAFDISSKIMLYMSMIRFHIISLFPESFESYLGSSMLKRAKEAGFIDVRLYNPRTYTTDKHRKADDRPYGGGPGMVMYAEPIISAAEDARKHFIGKKAKIFITSPRGKQFSNGIATALAKKYSDIVIIAGHYEGIDARVKKALKAEEVSIGDYILTGGELPAMVMIDSISRQIKGVLGDHESIEENRDTNGEAYTRPEVFEHAGKKYKVPKVLMSGNHAEIEKWRKGYLTK
jgi:tRNA (guanine37-N1)-methyltransferase